MPRLILLTHLLLVSFGADLFAQSNVDNTVPNKFAWGENIGWTNWRDANGALQGVVVGSFVMSGFIWGENIGWINVGDGLPANGVSYANTDGADFGVNIDYNGAIYDGTSDGALHGLAWGENIGWINFDGGAMAVPPQPARIVCGDVNGSVPARLTGYAWGENVGWINLSELGPAKFVSLSLAATPLLCDVNLDGTPNGLDVQAFVDLLLGGGGSWAAACAGDVGMPADGVVDLEDVDDFVECLLSQ